MIDITKDIQPLTTFRNNSVKMMQRLKKTRRPPSSSPSTANPKPSSRTPSPTSASSTSPHLPILKKAFVRDWKT